MAVLHYCVSSIIERYRVQRLPARRESHPSIMFSPDRPEILRRTKKAFRDDGRGFVVVIEGPGRAALRLSGRASAGSGG